VNFLKSFTVFITVKMCTAWPKNGIAVSELLCLQQLYSLNCRVIREKDDSGWPMYYAEEILY